MRRIGLAVVLIFALAQLAAAAQQGGKVHHVGFLVSASSSSPSVEIEVFKQVLRERGWVESENLSFVFQYADGHYERLSSMVHELLTLGVDGPASIHHHGGRQPPQWIPRER